ncbi:hypothetical protein [Stakelama pacifica]|uniref:Uncharacterized protein n=1 Tax=Stakelama pacifica TaxID=517720 RepID=A0A4R6FN34_9SPHN|nr:hypothetical protein [Stakelama pacifica]TDN83002.1 hypothetical protein EV664_105200 [Stakelama pacifica]GGO94960.1 hypothetical protein GCM10011329_18020 [Stakelama pacifica]
MIDRIAYLTMRGVVFAYKIALIVAAASICGLIAWKVFGANDLQLGIVLGGVTFSWRQWGPAWMRAANRYERKCREARP